MKSLLRLCLATAALGVIWSNRDAATARITTPAPVPAACNLSLPSPTQITLSGSTLGGIAINDACTHVYVTNTTLNRVEVYSLETNTLEAPIQVGAQPAGLDFTPDGSLFYVANSGGSNISVVDPVQRVELRKINVPSGFSNDKPYSIAVAHNGLALFSTTFPGSGFGGRLMQLVLATDQVSQRTDFGSVTDETRLGISGNRRIIGIVFGNNSGGDVYRYDAGANTFSPVKRLNTFIREVSLDMTGATMLANPFSGVFVLDAALNHTGTITLASGWGGAAIDPVTGTGYRPVGSTLEALNLSTFLKVGEFALGDSVSNAQGFNAVGALDVSADGKLVAVITNTGFSLVRPAPFAQPSVEMVTNGDFSSGLGNWLTFATPDMSYIVANIVAGVLEFHRVEPPPNESNQAVAFQVTGLALPSGAPLLATFDLGNSSSARKRVSVLVLDADFSDLHVCTFWLGPNQPLKTYQMQTHTTKPWTNAAIYFYAATEGSAGGAYRVDNVSLTYEPSLFNDWTDCVDANAPIAPGGPDGPNMIVNGNFSTGALSPWGLFGTITSRIFAGVFEFTRPSSTGPAGVILQATNQPMATNEIMVAFFRLGNNSTVRKRVTVILHDLNFSDLAACTFWLPPQQVLSDYAMAAFATQAWSNTTISIYAATVGTQQWTRLDDVALIRAPSVPLTGTGCFEPGSLAEAHDSSAREFGVAAPRPVPALLSRAASRRAADAGTVSIQPGAALFPLDEVIDLSTASRARLMFESWLPSADMYGAMQVSTDGVNWKTSLVILPADRWQSVEADLTEWAGQRIAVRFVLHSPASSDPTAAGWQVRNVRVDMNAR